MLKNIHFLCLIIQSNDDKSWNNRCAGPDSVDIVKFDADWKTQRRGRNYASHKYNFSYNWLFKTLNLL